MTVGPPTNVTFPLLIVLSFFQLVCISLRRGIYFTYVEFHRLVYTFSFLIFSPTFMLTKNQVSPLVTSPRNFTFLVFRLTPNVSIIPLDKTTFTKKRLFISFKSSPCSGRSVVGTVYVTVDLWRKIKWNRRNILNFVF